MDIWINFDFGSAVRGDKEDYTPLIMTVFLYLDPTTATDHQY